MAVQAAVIVTVHANESHKASSRKTILCGVLFIRSIGYIVAFVYACARTRIQTHTHGVFRKRFFVFPIFDESSRER